MKSIKSILVSLSASIAILYFGIFAIAPVNAIAFNPVTHVQAQADDPEIPKINNPTKTTNLAEVITKVIYVLLSIIAMASVIMIIISGFKMVGSGGNPGELSKAKSGLIWAILGLVVAVMSFSIISIVQRLIK